MSEQWRPVVGYEGLYEVSNQGRVRRIAAARGTRAGRVMTGNVTKWGHLRVGLSDGEKMRLCYVHRLVLEAFIGPCPEGMEACHWNDVPDDNRLSNLRWDTPAANNHDCVRNGHNLNVRKTHCPQGHEYTPENTYLYHGWRKCRMCIKARCRRYYSKRRAESAAA